MFNRIISYLLIGLVFSWAGATFARYLVESHNKTRSYPEFAYDTHDTFQCVLVFGILSTINFILFKYFRKFILSIPFLLFSISVIIGYILGFYNAYGGFRPFYVYSLNEEIAKKGIQFGLGIAVLYFAFDLLKRSQTPKQ